jgi:predicted RNase H-like HicB family nuclease
MTRPGGEILSQDFSPSVSPPPPLPPSTTRGGLARAGLVRQNYWMKKEFVFQIEQDDDMLVATCLEPEMATQGENLDELLAMIRDLIRCRFDAGDERLAWPIRLHFLHDPVLSAQVA